jgi:hypothetical protein
VCRFVKPVFLHRYHGLESRGALSLNIIIRLDDVYVVLARGHHIAEVAVLLAGVVNTTDVGADQDRRT